MTHSSASSILATAQIAVVLIGVPIWVLSRLSGPFTPVQAMDLVLVGAIALWAVVFNAIMHRDDPIDSLVLNRTSPAWFAHQLVDNSLLGTGAETDLTVEQSPAGLSRLVAPQPLTPDQLPLAVRAAERAWGPADLDGARSTSVGVVLADEPVATSSDPGAAAIATQDYLVSRRDTFWSIAESILGDGRRWQELQALNIGHQVAPGIELDENHELRIGWTILVPATEAKVE